MSFLSDSCSCAVSTASTGFQLMMRHVSMASLYLLSSVHTGGPSSKAPARIDVMQKQFLQLCCFYSFRRVSAHDATCLYGVAVHTGGPSSKAFTRIDVMHVACYVSLLEISHMTQYMTHCCVHAVLCNSRKATFSYVDCLRAMVQSV